MTNVQTAACILVSHSIERTLQEDFFLLNFNFFSIHSFIQKKSNKSQQIKEQHQWKRQMWIDLVQTDRSRIKVSDLNSSLKLLGLCSGASSMWRHHDVKMSHCATSTERRTMGYPPLGPHRRADYWLTCSPFSKLTCLIHWSSKWMGYCRWPEGMFSSSLKGNQAFIPSMTYNTTEFPFFLSPSGKVYIRLCECSALSRKCSCKKMSQEKQLSELL